MKKNKQIIELTPREKEIVLLCVKEHSRKLIAADLNISIRTVDTHLKNIHLKTKKFSMAGVVSFGCENLKEEIIPI